MSVQTKTQKFKPGKCVGTTSVLTWVRLVRWMWPVWLAQYSQSLYQSRSNDRMPSSVLNSWVLVNSVPLNSNMLMLVMVAYRNLGSVDQKKILMTPSSILCYCSAADKTQ